MAAHERVPMTPKGFEVMRLEIDHLKSVERPKTVIELEDARAHGDLSENAEYHAAKERLGYIDGRIQDLEGILGRAEVIDPKTMAGSDKVMFGALVKLLDRDDDSEVSYQIVGEYESDVEAGKISVMSPIARGLIGKRVESEVSIKTPRGVKEFEILSVEYL